MADREPNRLYRFGVFEADAATGELRRKGARVRINAQPFQVLLLLMEQPGKVITREQIARSLWPDGTFVDFEQGVNSAVNRLREALGDSAASPRYIETLARRGYRFVAPVECLDQDGDLREPEPHAGRIEAAAPASVSRPGLLASADDLPRPPHRVVQVLFVLLQVMYLGFYVGALSNLAEIAQILAPLKHPELAYNIVLVSAAILLPVRAFLLTAAFFHPPGFRHRFVLLWPFILFCDVLWSLSPFLLLHHITTGLALACMAILVYSPFAQRALVLMGAGHREAVVPAEG